ncbi:hypothetical protein XENOCAPTIV_013118 [Xenoophorus captivus]|uniref:Immunoglobulin V-set domain-containing protein n=1 Tax=Xenoophorus captivus TaxID=1517983 RepID=A0ABV0RYX1_9TELE
MSQRKHREGREKLRPESSSNETVRPQLPYESNTARQKERRTPTQTCSSLRGLLMTRIRMEIQHTLFFCFITGASFLSNTAAPTYMQSAGLPIYTAMEGQSISFEFPFTLVGGGRRYLCKEECKLNNIIIETNTPEAQHGRYSLRYHEGLLQVTIKELKASDSGRYRCGVASSSGADLYEEMVEIRVNKVVSWSTTSSTRSRQQPSEETTPGRNP